MMPARNSIGRVFLDRRYSIRSALLAARDESIFLSFSFLDRLPKRHGVIDFGLAWVGDISLHLGLIVLTAHQGGQTTCPAK